mmetsp:Transcript_7458/g.11654  ORF Transcript_7458/g.11654 Transcript_7458/m.11654 type:complete len:152 (+) Transcript_7458:1264-1719(+)
MIVFITPTFCSKIIIRSIYVSSFLYNTIVKQQHFSTFEHFFSETLLLLVTVVATATQYQIMSSTVYLLLICIIVLKNSTSSPPEQERKNPSCVPMIVRRYHHTTLEDSGVNNVVTNYRSVILSCYKYRRMLRNSSPIYIYSQQSEQQKKAP